MTDLSHIPVLVPEGVVDPSELLPMGVLDSASNHLGCDFIEAVRGEVPGKRYAAWAELAYQLARLNGTEKPQRETYRAYTTTEITHALGWDRVIGSEGEEEDPTRPTGSSTANSAPVLSGSP